MPTEPSGAGRGSRRSIPAGLLVVAATYVAFLLFAQFGFLAQLRHDLAEPGRVKGAMAAMGIAGLAASLGTSWLLGRVAGRRLVRWGLWAVAAVAVSSLACHGFASLLVAAAAIGGAIGLLTVALAASLPEIVPPGSAGLCAGAATGAAYFLSNVPALFEASPAVRALVPAALAAAAALFAPAPERASAAEPAGARPPRGGGAPAATRGGFLRILVTFLVLIWLDSAAFAIVQASPALKAATWGSAGQKLLQGGVHLVAAVGAGALLDAGFALAVPLAAWGLFALAFPLLQHGGGAAAWAGPLYAVGISFYSVALVLAPTLAGSRSSPSPRFRAGLLYGVAGWLGSALGVGMAQDLGCIPAWFLGATGAALALAWLPLGPLFRRFGPALGLGAAGAAALWLAAARTEAAPRGEGSDAAVARGRRVYVQEGCIHCHSQYVRAGTRDEGWWGPSRPLDRSERPPLVGTRRQGPDLLQVGNRRSGVWQEEHLRDPRRLNPGSRMPSYAHLFAGDGGRGRDLVAYLSSLGDETVVERWEMTEAEGPAPAGAAAGPGSAARGARLFAAYCAVCHGASGRGDGPLAAAVNDPNADLRKPGGFRTRLPLAGVVRHGLPTTSMPGHEWLTGGQVGDLVAFVQTLENPEKIR